MQDLGSRRRHLRRADHEPSTQDILTAVNRVPAETVFVFPNNKNIIMAAEQVDPLTEKRVSSSLQDHPPGHHRHAEL
ncbi:MAG: hypothetical protein ACLU9S_24095 [Oscillospiraceae bacterium]